MSINAALLREHCVLLDRWQVGAKTRFTARRRSKQRPKTAATSGAVSSGSEVDAHAICNLQHKIKISTRSST